MKEIQNIFLGENPPNAEKLIKEITNQFEGVHNRTPNVLEDEAILNLASLYMLYHEKRVGKEYEKGAKKEIALIKYLLPEIYAIKERLGIMPKDLSKVDTTTPAQKIPRSNKPLTAIKPAKPAGSVFNFESKEKPSS